MVRGWEVLDIAQMDFCEEIRKEGVADIQYMNSPCKA